MQPDQYVVLAMAAIAIVAAAGFTVLAVWLVYRDCRPAPSPWRTRPSDEEVNEMLLRAEEQGRAEQNRPGPAGPAGPSRTGAAQVFDAVLAVAQAVATGRVEAASRHEDLITALRLMDDKIDRLNAAIDELSERYDERSGEGLAVSVAIRGDVNPDFPDDLDTSGQSLRNCGIVSMG